MDIGSLAAIPVQYPMLVTPKKYTQNKGINQLAEELFQMKLSKDICETVY